MKVQIKSATSTNHREYKGRYYGEQQAALVGGQADFPLAFRLNVERGAEYPPGDYELDPASFHTDEHGNLRMKRVRLLPTKAAPAPAKAVA
jgi:hypothetical protein